MLAVVHVDGGGEIMMSFLGSLCDGCPVGDLTILGILMIGHARDSGSALLPLLLGVTFPPKGLTTLPELTLNLLCSTGWVPAHTSAFASLMLVTLSLGGQEWPGK